MDCRNSSLTLPVMWAFASKAWDVPRRDAPEEIQPGRVF
jgi:hypothetical protein